MPQKNAGELKKAILLFAVVSGLLGAANSFGEANYANYFKEVYHATAAQRGFIEFPRELPGVLSMFLISAFGVTGDVTIAFLAQDVYKRQIPGRVPFSDFQHCSCGQR